LCYILRVDVDVDVDVVVGVFGWLDVFGFSI